MEFVSVFDPSFSAFGRTVPGHDTAALEQALFARRQPEEGMVFVTRIADPRLRLTAKDLKQQLLGDAPASTVLYSGRNTSPRRLLRTRNGAFLIGAYDFILLVTTREERPRRKLAQDQVTAFFVPGRVLIELYGTTLHCVPCHTHDRDGMNVLMLIPSGPLRKKARQESDALIRRLRPKRTEAPAGEAAAPRWKRLPKKPTEIRLVKPVPPGEEDDERTVPQKLKHGVASLRKISARKVYGKLRWRAHIAARLREPPEDL